MQYECHRCGSTDFKIDISTLNLSSGPHHKYHQEYLVMCPNCGGYQGQLDINK